MRENTWAVTRSHNLARKRLYARRICSRTYESASERKQAFSVALGKTMVSRIRLVLRAKMLTTLLEFYPE